MYQLSVITQDKDLIRDLKEVLSLFPDWQLEAYNNMEIAYIALFKREPEITILDLDMISSNPPNINRQVNIQRKAPLIIFVSSYSISKCGQAELVMGLRPFDYIKKPTDLDKIVFALSVAQQPLPVV